MFRNPRYNVATIDGLSLEMLHEYKQRDLPQLQALIGGAVAGLRDARDFVDWFDHCTRLSEERLVLQS